MKILGNIEQKSEKILQKQKLIKSHKTIKKNFKK